MFFNLSNEYFMLVSNHRTRYYKSNTPTARPGMQPKIAVVIAYILVYDWLTVCHEVYMYKAHKYKYRQPSGLSQSLNLNTQHTV